MLSGLPMLRYGEVKVLSLPQCFKKSRSDEEQGADRQPARASRQAVDNQADSGLERSYSRLSALAFGRTCRYRHF